MLTIWPQEPNLLRKYVPVYEMPTYSFWKFDSWGEQPVFRAIYVHKSLLKTHHLTSIESHEWDING